MTRLATAAALAVAALALALPAPAHALPCLEVGAASASVAPRQLCVLNATTG